MQLRCWQAQHVSILQQLRGPTTKDELPFLSRRCHCQWRCRCRWPTARAVAPAEHLANAGERRDISKLSVWQSAACRSKHRGLAADMGGRWTAAAPPAVASHSAAQRDWATQPKTCERSRTPPVLPAMQALSCASSFAAGAPARAGPRRRPHPARAVPRPEQKQSQDAAASVMAMTAGALAAPLLLLVSEGALRDAPSPGRSLAALTSGSTPPASAKCAGIPDQRRPCPDGALPRRLLRPAPAGAAPRVGRPGVWLRPRPARG